MHPFPLRVGVMEDDYYALQWLSVLLARDLRTKVVIEAEGPARLLEALKLGRSGHDEPDILLINADYQKHVPPLNQLLEQAATLAKHSSLICLAQAVTPQLLHQVVEGGARGLLLKSELRLALVPALVQATRVRFLITPGVLPLLPHPLLAGIKIFRAWQPHPALTPQLSRIFTLRVLYGMNSAQAAEEANLAPSTVEKYMQMAYARLARTWGDEHSLAGLDLDCQQAEVRAFHHYSLPPDMKNY